MFSDYTFPSGSNYSVIVSRHSLSCISGCTFDFLLIQFCLRSEKKYLSYKISHIQHFLSETCYIYTFNRDNHKFVWLFRVANLKRHPVHHHSAEYIFSGPFESFGPFWISLKIGRAYRGLTGWFLLHRNFSVAISVGPHVCFILDFILISIFLR